MVKSLVRKQILKSRNFRIVVGAVIIVLLFEFAYVCDCAQGWNKMYIDQIYWWNEIRRENVSLKIRTNWQGALYETCSPSSLVATVESCSNNQVNNVWYIGSADGFDYFIHNSDFMTHRVRVDSARLNESRKMRVTSNARKWVAVSRMSHCAAGDLSAFLEGRGGTR